MSKEATIARFDNVSFEYSVTKPILNQVTFSVRKGAKLTLMGQNGAGKSTIFNLLTGSFEPEEGVINVVKGTTIATARQVITRDQMDLTVREFFQSQFANKIYDLDPKIDEVLEVVNLSVGKGVHDKMIKSFSGGQQARLLLASALIQDPDLLLLDEPTNNLDAAGIAHLTKFLIDYKKTVMVISHDAEFLNAFTEGVLYLDIYTRKIEQYVGDYNDVIKDIAVRIEKENMKNAMLAKEIQAKKEKANQFAYKGGQMRLVAKRMREKAEELEEDIVDVRKEDKTIRPFIIPAQTDTIGEIITISAFTVLKNHKIVSRKAAISLRKNQHLLLRGPNGIGKSTLLESIANGTADGSTIGRNVRVGYYRQDFSTLDFNDSVYEALKKSMALSGARPAEDRIRSVAASFLITSDTINTRIGSLSEGQKGLVAFATLVLLEPGLLILDEPTNHINFRHLPVIAKALSSFTGAMILVSHVNEFVQQIRIDEILDLDA
jgi:ATP-binding cassette subfamily F protein 3